VWVVIDGSDDGSDEAAAEIAGTDTGVRVLRLDRNRGKGGAVEHGLEAARAAGFTHALVMDADGQHPADRIAAFMAASTASPEAVIMGRPVFGAEAPWPRVLGRRVSNGLARLQTLRAVGDTLFGFRVYPITRLLAVMRETRGMRRFDFDPEAIVRLAWRGAPLIHLPASVRYLAREEGGVSHFNYLRDNALLAAMNVRLAWAGLARLPRALARRR
jgi:glycosyltransferase involved in cell wall biosynthesis